MKRVCAVSCFCCGFLWRRWRKTRERELELKRVAELEQEEMLRGCQITSARLRTLLEQVGRTCHGPHSRLVQACPRLGRLLPVGLVIPVHMQWVSVFVYRWTVLCLSFPLSALRRVRSLNHFIAVNQLAIREIRKKFIEAARPPAVGKESVHTITPSGILDWVDEPRTAFLEFLVLRLVRYDLVAASLTPSRRSPGRPGVVLCATVGIGLLF